MKTPQVLATVAIAGAVAALAVLNSNTAPAHQAFLATPITDAEREFISFVAHYHRSFGTKEEYNYRLAIFTDNYNDIISHNAENSMTYTKGINHLSDLTPEEFNQRKGAKLDTTPNKTYIPLDRTTTASNGSVDWRTTGAGTTVKDQGQCGSCWAFSTTGTIEGIYKIQTGKSTLFSEQQLVDCTLGRGGNAGCNGGWPAVAMNYASETPLEVETTYPYETATR
jgi:C1A family cysteine protease